MVKEEVQEEGKSIEIVEKGKEVGDLRYYDIGFSTSKMRVDDLEKLYDAGFNSSGTYFW